MQMPMPKWAAVLILGVLVCVLAYIVAVHGYSLKLNSHIIELEMRPGTAQAPPIAPPRLP